MGPLGVFLLALTITVYAIAALAHIAYLYSEEWNRAATWLIRLAVFFHTLALVDLILETGHPPLTSLFESVLFLTWVLMLNYALVDAFYRAKAAGLFLIPLSFIFLLGAVAAPKVSSDVPAFTGARAFWHITVSFLGYGFFALSFIAAVMYLIQDKQLRDKEFRLIFYRLPSLEALDRAGSWMIQVGFPLLTVGIITGGLWASVAWTRWAGEWKVIWSIFTWIIYGAYLLVRWVWGWRGRRAAYLSIAGFAAVVLNYFVINLFVTRLHEF